MSSLKNYRISLADHPQMVLIDIRAVEGLELKIAIRVTVPPLRSWRYSIMDSYNLPREQDVVWINLMGSEHVDIVLEKYDGKWKQIAFMYEGTDHSPVAADLTLFGPIHLAPGELNRRNIVQIEDFHEFMYDKFGNLETEPDGSAARKRIRLGKKYIGRTGAGEGKGSEESQHQNPETQPKPAAAHSNMPALLLAGVALALGAKYASTSKGRNKIRKAGRNFKQGLTKTRDGITRRFRQSTPGPSMPRRSNPPLIRTGLTEQYFT